MKTTKLIKELLIGGIAVAPVLYFFYLWNSLPTVIPIHFDEFGKPNNYGSRSTIALTLLFLSVGTYLLLLFIPKIDPKKNFSVFSDTFIKLRVILSVLFSALCFIIIFSVKDGELNPSYLYLVLAVMIMLLGNYMSNIRPNYFIGVRTPWALESEENWKKTHFFTSRLWFFMGIVWAIMVFVLPDNIQLYVLISVVVVLVLLPIIYSYSIYNKKDKPQGGNDKGEKQQKLNSGTTDVWHGLFYVNRFDSRILVPKRNKMMGWTLNFGNPYAYLIIVILIALIIASQYIH